jgi:hypothetical protein
MRGRTSGGKSSQSDSLSSFYSLPSYTYHKHRGSPKGGRETRRHGRAEKTVAAALARPIPILRLIPEIESLRRRKRRKGTLQSSSSS